jgi:uncharacterized protein (DUF2235 family)
MSTDPSNSAPAPAASPVAVASKPRTLVLCFDGTTNEYNNNITNVIKLYSLLRKDKVEEQLCYYQVSAPVYSSQHSYVLVDGSRNVFRAGCR